MNTQLIARGLLKGVNAGGITVDAVGNTVGLGIAVAAYPEGEYVCKYKHTTYLLPEIEERLGSLSDRVRPHNHFGCWVDDKGAVVLDVIEVLPQTSLALAVLKAKSRNQKAIQLLHPNTTLWLTEPHESTGEKQAFTLADLKDAYEEGYYEGAGDDAWYRDHDTPDSSLAEDATVHHVRDVYIKEKAP